MSGRTPARLLGVWVLTLAVWGCDDPAVPERLHCATNAQCPSGHHCAPTGLCAADRGCLSDDDCCLAERCEDRKCQARQACSASAWCLDPGQVCALGVCVPKGCSSVADCGEGRTCLWGTCVDHTPCGGVCPAGRACAVGLDRCVPGSGPACPPGALPVIANELALMPEGCALVPRQIECRALPPLPDGERGWPGTLLAQGSSLVHVGYDRTYGDVVATTYGASPPFVQQGTRWLLGIPEKAQVVGDPSGPRRGVADPGPDVGRRLAAVALGKDGWAVVARDDSADAVLWAEVHADASPLTYTLTSGSGVGEALAIATMLDGRPVVAAFAPADPSKAPAVKARVTLWSATVIHPAGPADWQSQQVDSEAVPALEAPCGGPCPAGQDCVLTPSGSQQCAAPSSGCGACRPGQLCALGHCSLRVVGPPPLDREPLGRGASLALLTLSTGQLVVAAYSSATGDLAIYRQTAGGWDKTLVTGDVVQGKTQDIGRFVRLLEGDKGEPWVVCEDGQSGRLLLLRPTGVGFGATVLDAGTRADGIHRVGADIAAARHPFGGLMVAHQDTRRGDLLLLRQAQPGQAGASEVAAATGATGFSPSIVQLGNKAWVVATTTLTLTPSGNLQTRVHLLNVVWNGE